MAFCGMCLRESPIYDLAANPAVALYAAAATNEVGVLENEDEDTFPGIEATCRSCRSEWLWKKASPSSRDQDALGGMHFTSDDWETRQSVDGFIELAEGTVADVINLAREKYWLRKFTRLGDMMQQALAAAKFNSSSSGYNTGAVRGGGGEYGTPGWDENAEEEEEEEEEDTELMQLEEGGVKDLALGDWARTRILDGYWISPADIWYRNFNPGKPLDMPAVHPCSWTITPSSSADSPSYSPTSTTETPATPQHPSPSIVNAEIPPSFNLCEQAFIAHGQQLRLILLPAMKNIVRRIAIECAMSDISGGEDPTLKASRMSLEQVAQILREEEGVWFDGYDWVERRRNEEEARRERHEREHSDRSEPSEPSEPRSPSQERSRQRRSSRSDSSVGSNTTSPVLSTTTLQTTPSPPPLSDEGGDNSNNTKKPITKCSPDMIQGEWDAVIASRVLIPIEPVLNPPKILRSIPHVPLTIAHLPQFSLDAFKNVRLLIFYFLFC